MRISREILCGLTYSDITSCAGMSQKAAAEKLGVNYCHFNQRMKRLGMTHYFNPARHRCISKEDIIATAGMCQIDAAEVLGVTNGYLSVLIHEYGIRHLFPGKSKRRTPCLHDYR